MIKKTFIVLFVIIFLIFLYPKAYDSAGGYEGKDYSNENKCIGFSYEYEPANCDDCYSVRYCVGIPVFNSI